MAGPIDQTQRFHLILLTKRPHNFTWNSKVTETSNNRPITYHTPPFLLLVLIFPTISENATESVMNYPIRGFTFYVEGVKF